MTQPLPWKVGDSQSIRPAMPDTCIVAHKVIKIIESFFLLPSFSHSPRPHQFPHSHILLTPMKEIADFSNIWSGLVIT